MIAMNETNRGEKIERDREDIYHFAALFSFFVVHIYICCKSYLCDEQHISLVATL